MPNHGQVRISYDPRDAPTRINTNKGQVRLSFAPYPYAENTVRTSQNYQK